MQEDLRIISATYKTTPEEDIVVEVYGKTKEGRSIVLRDEIRGPEPSAKRPYCFVMQPDDRLRRALENRREVLGVIDTPLFHRGEVRSAVKVILKLPKQVKQLRDELSGHYDVLAADILFYLRYIYDQDLGACVRAFGELSARQSDYSADIVMDVKRYEEVQAFTPPMRVLSFDLENSLKNINTNKAEYIPEDALEEEVESEEFFNKRILTVCAVVTEGTKVVASASLHGNERKILEDFSAFIVKQDPDVVSGYNIEGYDLRILFKRAQELRVPLTWGRDRSRLERRAREGDKFTWTVMGRMIVDVWWAVKMELRPKQESLRYISKLLLDGDGKLDVDASRMDEEWAKDQAKCVEYCTKDAELSGRILEKIGRLRKVADLATVSKLPMDDIMKNRNSLLIDSILIRAADRETPRVAVPLTRNFRDEGEAIEGGYVHEIEPGLYHWVVVLDFKSMYPSIIIARNICFTTLSSRGTTVSPIDENVRFLDKAEKQGILPRILSGLMKERDLTKKKMREAASREEAHYYDGLQQAVKVLMNAFYGVFASSFYRFTDKNIGSSITAFARETTKGIIHQLEEENLHVIYSDTDSVFVQSPVQELEAAKKFGSETAERFSREGGSLEFEKIMEPLFSHGKKKRYVGKMVWPKEELVIRGYEVRRTDSFDLQSETLMAVFEKVLSGSTDEAVKEARRIVQETLAGKVPVEKLVISKGCRPFNQYANPDSQAPVQTARKLQAMGFEFVPGMKVSWIVTDSRKSPQELEPYIAGRPFTATPDYRYYAKRVAQTVSRVTEVFGWDEESLMSGNQQRNLFDAKFDEEKTAVLKKEEVRKTDKKLTLDDFM
jgi:DNA polymerase I